MVKIVALASKVLKDPLEEFLFCEIYLVKFIAMEPLVAQMVKSLPAMQETQVPSLCWEDPLEKEMATHSSILAWRIPRTK